MPEVDIITKDAEQALKDKLAALEKRKAEREQAARLRDLEAQLKRAEREAEDAALEEKLAAEMPDRELGVHYDYLRFGDHLVAFAHNKSAHEIFLKKMPDKGQVPPSEARNFVVRSLVEVDGVSDQSQRADAFDKVAAEFGGAANAIANVLLELAKGGTAIRSGK